MTTTDLQHSIHEARSRDKADSLYAARDSVLAFLSSTLTHTKYCGGTPTTRDGGCAICFRRGY